jgi:hypothetical protein
LIFVEINGEVGAIGVENYTGSCIKGDVIEGLVEDEVVPPVSDDPGTGSIFSFLFPAKGSFNTPVPEDKQKVEILYREFFADFVQPVPESAAFSVSMGELFSLRIFDEELPAESPSLFCFMTLTVLVLFSFFTTSSASPCVVMKM